MRYDMTRLRVKHTSLILALLLGLLAIFPSSVSAWDGTLFGIHILNTGEIEKAKELVKTNEDSGQWQFITVPYTLDDSQKTEQWQNFFNRCKELRLIPIVRLSTKFENGAWQIPTRKDVVQLLDTLAAFDWPTDRRHIIFFNEVNHAKEWGNKLDPAGYAAILQFGAAWAKTGFYNEKVTEGTADSEPVPSFVVLPAAMDLAAPNSSVTREAFSYLTEMLKEYPEVFDQIDYWNSHSYPNPAFSASPERNGQNSLRGFTYELAFLKQKLNKDFQVFITETGWTVNQKTRKWLSSYYLYALQHIWSDPRVVAVTPFVLQGDPGPFSEFGFFDKSGKPTIQYDAYRQAVQTWEKKQ